MNNKRLLILLSLMFFNTCIFSVGKTEGNDKKAKSLAKVMGEPGRTFLNINNISTQFYNNGSSDIDPSGKPGFVYPKGSGKTAVLQSGLLWGAYYPGDPQPRVGGSAYRQGLTPGRILANGTPEDPTGALVRIFRVRADIYPGGPVVDLSAAAAEEGTDAVILRAQYEKDWTEWPYDQGAPGWTDELGAKHPGVKWADQTIWYVTNDLDAQKTTFLYGAQPLGIEQQTTIWAYAQNGALGNMLFRRYKLINKSTATFDSMYVSQWCDPEIGNGSDDFSGCDSALSLGYSYNSQNVDTGYNPLPPPAAGFDLLQGPVIPGVAGQDKNNNQIDDSQEFAIKNNQKIGPGYINLPMTAFYYYENYDPLLHDPAQGVIKGSTEFYRYFKGQIGSNGHLFYDAKGVLTQFALNGDPISRTGWVDGYWLPAGDRKMGLASGPFQMAPGDTQEVVVAEIVAGATTKPFVDRLAAIGLLKFYDKRAQNTYDNLFALPGPPPAPALKTVELNKEIVLDWGDDLTAVARTETSDELGYKFQGYNVYQLPSAFADLSSGIRIATFDINDGIGKILDDYFNAASGSVLTAIVQFGTDNGVQRYIDIKTDELNGGVPLTNGNPYYYAVTAYSFKDKATPNNLESLPQIFTVIPDSTAEYPQSTGDTLKAVHSKGSSDGSVIPLVINPKSLTGHKYKVTFDTSSTAGKYVWSLIDVTSNKTLLRNQSNQSGDPDYMFVDGMQVKVVGPPPGVKDYTIPSGTRRFTSSGGTGLGFEGYGGSIGYASPRSVYGDGTMMIPPGDIKNVLLKLATVDTASWYPTFDPNDPNVSYAYRYGRYFYYAAADPKFAPFIINQSSGYSFQDFKKSVPLSAWDVSDTAHPRRLEVGFLENNAVNGLVDGKWWPGDYNVYDNTATTGPREWLWIFDSDYSETPNPAYTVDPMGGPQPIMYFLTVNRRGNVPFSPGGTGTDQFEILAYFVNTSEDEFTFTNDGVSSTKNSAKSISFALQQNYPNPFNPSTKIKFSIPEQSQVKLEIFNVLGQRVKTLVNQELTKGVYEREFDGSRLSSGVYIYRIEAGKYTESRKMMLLK